LTTVTGIDNVKTIGKFAFIACPIDDQRALRSGQLSNVPLA